METIITFTGSKRKINNRHYDYSCEDRMVNTPNGDLELYYSGQNQGRLDHQLVESVNASSTFIIYGRENGNSPFTFLGETNDSIIVNERTIPKGINAQPNERLQIKLVIPFADIRETKVISKFEGFGKYKKAVLKHSGFDTVTDVVRGFYVKCN